MIVQENLFEYTRNNDPLDTLNIGSGLPKQFAAMHSFFLFLHNFDYDFISDVWGGTFLENHLKDKWKGKATYYKDSRSALLSFIADLDDDNRKLLYTYILKRHEK